MVLGDLSVNFNSTSLPSKEIVEEQLRKVLPAGSFMVLIRNYAAGDARRNTQVMQQLFQIVISVRRAGREVAMVKKGELEALGFRVSEHGEISLN